MSIFTHYFITMKTYLLTFAFMAFSPFIYGQQTGDFRSRSNGLWTDVTSATPWETYDGSNWIVATTLPAFTSDVTIKNGHAITLPGTGQRECKDLNVETGAVLYTLSTSTILRYLNVYGDILCDGAIGNGTSNDNISFNIMGNTTISGNGNFDCYRIRQNNPGITCNLTINNIINMHFGGTCLYNNASNNGSIFNVIISNGATVNVTGDGTIPGSVSIDGANGAGTGNSQGNFTINGNLIVSGSLYLTTNNTTTINGSFPVSFTIGTTGIVETNTINAAGSGTSGHTFTINNGGVLKITGDNTPGFTQPDTTNNIYIFNPGSAIEYSGSGNQYIYDFGVDYQNLKTSGSGVKSLQAPAGIIESLEVTGASSFNTNNHSCTLKSTALQTAIVKNITSATFPAVVGDITIERYIPARRAWRLLAAPLSSANAPAIFDSWQEGGISGASLPGYGTWITSAGTADPGFDAASGTSSLRYYDASTDAFITPSNTNTTKVTDSTGAYMIFIRGDRTQTGSGTANNTTLRMTGTINQGNVTCGSNVANTQFTVVPNPYPSPVDFEAIYNSNTNLTSFYIWDAQNGTYGMYRLVTRTGTGTYTCVPTTSNDNDMRFIQSGQAFFIQGTAAGGASTVTFTETMKAGGTPSINVFKTTNTASQLLSINLEKQTVTGNLLNDGIAILFDSSYTTAFSNEDIKKLTNFNENLSVRNDTNDLALERRPVPGTADTIQLHLWNASTANYQFTIMPDNLNSFGTIYLLDNYLSTMTPLSITNSSTYNFSIGSAAGSYDPFRFSLIFTIASPLTLSKLTLKGVVKGQAAALQWEALNENGVKQYGIERSTDEGRTFDKLNMVAPQSNLSNNVSYSFLDESIREGNNYYRIKGVRTDGSEVFSNIIRLSYDNVQPAITIFPNPMHNNKLQMNFRHVEEGVYLVTVYNMSGVFMDKAIITHSSQNTTHTLSFSKTFAAGMYVVDVMNDATGVSYSQIVQIE